METTPLACAQFIRRCLKPCTERNPPQEAHCPICTEEYDRSTHKAIRVVIQSPAQCNHEFCQACLEKIFARRKTQDNTNLCPLCRAVWFKAEYESLSARSRRLTEEATEVLRAGNSAPSLFAGVPEGPAGETMSDSTRRDTDPVPQPMRTPRPYARARQPRPSTTESSAGSRDTRYSGDWRTEPVFTHREFHAALAAGQAAAGQPEPPATTSVPHTSSHPPRSTPQPFQFGQQPTPYSALPQRAQFNYPPDDSNSTNSTRQGEQNRAAPPQAFQSLEFQRRSADLDAREARLTRREGELRRMRQALERREQDFNVFCERGRQLFRGRDGGV
ncbi:uncharacterized protein J4E88_010179 [Alternaria novae-zelandiae]|uniref:uncharacterized protein n=1 Tax=Alternaria novae-zelandiae TaxID=430562 RepID=UPI0020C438E6|nr:uncharacterized protein J4E88_010179 [Alternaria novae-zelandiae]KAI4667659.1 hypothetical protein J4E88_010179 [Alternaria novae-zelandiae]